MVTQKSPEVQFLESGTADWFLKEHILSNGFRRVLIVTGKKSFSWFQERHLIQSLEAISSVQRWSDVRPNPDIEDLHQVLAVARDFGPDIIVGIGGGSVIDMAKLVAGLTNNPTPLDQVLASSQSINNRQASLVLVPTTAGSGAEATHFAVLYRQGIKHSIEGNGLIADLAILDPSLIKSGSARQLAASGLDALSQCVESLWSKKATPVSRQKAEAGLNFLVPNFVAFAGGDTSRTPQMQRGSNLSGQAINISRTTGPHALSYFLTTNYGVPHGIAAASTVGLFIDHHNETLRKTPTQSPNSLASSMATISRLLGMKSKESGTNYFDQLFDDLGLAAPATYWPPSAREREIWFQSANAERLGNHPTDLPASAPTP